MNDGDVLLLDEPMAGVEGQVYETMKQVVRDKAAAGRAVCVVEHNVSFIRDLCTRAVFMFNGRIEQTGTVEELLASDKLAELYFGGKNSRGHPVLPQSFRPLREADRPSDVSFQGARRARRHSAITAPAKRPSTAQSGQFQARFVPFSGPKIEPGAVYLNTRHGIGFVPQGHNVFKSLSVERNPTLPGCTTRPRAHLRAFRPSPSAARSSPGRSRAASSRCSGSLAR
jgi:hypothetical protein